VLALCSGLSDSDEGGVLDPAAGTGAFLVRVLSRAREMGGFQAASRLLARITAIEILPLACALLELNLAIQWAIACAGAARPLPPIRVINGDALSAYSEFPPDSRTRCDNMSESSCRWSCDAEALASVALDAGFICVVGNPPYVGESGHKALFASYRSHPFWRRYSEPKMDFLQYFVVLGLSKIQQRDGARLCFLTSSYWLTADGAQGLRDLVLSQTVLREVILLNRLRLFPDAPGHDSAVVLLERCSNASLRGKSRALVVNVQPELLADGACTAGLATWISSALDASPPDEKKASRFPQSQAALLGKPWFLTVAADDLRILTLLEKHPPLTMYFVARQGLVPGAQRVGHAELAALGPDWVTAHGVRKGEGIFVLTDEEVVALNLPSQEKRFLRPFIKNSDIIPYAVDMTKPLWLIYLHHKEAEEEDCPRLLAHLARFRPLLTRKREYLLGHRDWFHLHWPRDEALFLGEKVVTPHRGGRPAFAWTREPLYAATDVYFLVHQYGLWQGCSEISLKALSGILNSALGWFWFAHRTKVKGDQREFFSRALEQFPLPRSAVGEGKVIREDALAKLERYVEDLQTLSVGKSATRETDDIKDLQRRVNEIVFTLYGLDSTARVYLREWFRPASQARAR
jgi:adenine-specific DNA-methyltransferase